MLLHWFSHFIEYILSFCLKKAVTKEMGRIAFLYLWIFCLLLIALLLVFEWVIPLMESYLKYSTFLQIKTALRREAFVNNIYFR